MSTQDRDLEADRVRSWLTEVLRRTALKPSPLAQQAGISPSTVLRALDPRAPTALSRASILRIVRTFGVPEPGNMPNAPGFAEDDLIRLEAQPPAFAGHELTPNQYVARAGTRILDLAGILPGDEMLMDMSVPPVASDVVAAQVYAIGGPAAVTVLRVYDPPYLVAHTSDATQRAKPIVVDGERARIAAVALVLLRQRATG